MQIICIYAGVSPYEQKLDYVVNIFKNTLNEINVTVDIIDITKLNLNYYNGTRQPIVENILNNIRNAQGVIFATTANRLAPNGAMQVFFEHLDYNIYPNVLVDKPYISIITSSDDSEYIAGNYISSLMGNLGAVSLNHMLIGKEYLQGIEMSIEITQMVEKYAEDFYRVVKQNRKFFKSSLFKVKKDTFQNEQVVFEKHQNENTTNKNFNIQPISNEDGKQIRSVTGTQIANMYKKEIDNSIGMQKAIPDINRDTTSINSYNNTNNLYGGNSLSNSNDNTNQYYNNKDSQTSNISIQSFNSTQQEDIDKITKLLSQRYQEETNERNELNQFISRNYSNNSNSSNNNFNTNTFNNNNVSENNNFNNYVAPSVSTLKQRTQSLYHYFQPQLATNVNTIMQVSVFGKENFNGFFTIKNGECTYTDGINPSAEVSIMSDSSVWEDVLKGKCTLQKAFMLGKLKVKGNFVIISKFEQFFKIV